MPRPRLSSIFNSRKTHLLFFLHKLASLWISPQNTRFDVRWHRKMKLERFLVDRATVKSTIQFTRRSLHFKRNPNCLETVHFNISSRQPQKGSEEIGAPWRTGVLVFVWSKLRPETAFEWKREWKWRSKKGNFSLNYFESDFFSCCQRSFVFVENSIQIPKLQFISKLQVYCGRSNFASKHQTLVLKNVL